MLLRSFFLGSLFIKDKPSPIRSCISFFISAVELVFRVNSTNSVTASSVILGFERIALIFVLAFLSRMANRSGTRKYRYRDIVRLGGINIEPIIAGIATPKSIPNKAIEH